MVDGTSRGSPGCLPVTEMYDAAFGLELVTRDEVVELLLGIPSVDPGLVQRRGPEPTRESLLRLFETEQEALRRVAAAVWWAYGVESNGDVRGGMQGSAGFSLTPDSLGHPALNVPLILEACCGASDHGRSDGGGGCRS